MGVLTGSKGSYDDIIIYPEIAELDEDGNTRTRPDWANGYAAKARFQVQGQSGTSARRAEQDNEGYTTEKVYRMRVLDHPTQIGAQACVEWHGERWSIFGDTNWYNSSPRTKHNDYTVKRF